MPSREVQSVRMHEYRSTMRIYMESGQNAALKPYEKGSRHHNSIRQKEIYRMNMIMDQTELKKELKQQLLAGLEEQLLLQFLL